MRPEDELEVIRHQTMPDDTHGPPFAGVGDQFQKGAVVAVFVEDFRPPIAAVQDVIRFRT